MYEIKPRGLWRGKKDNGKWVWGDLLVTPNSEGRRSYSIMERKAVAACYKVSPLTLGECTGLKDKCGKLIFEGDILETVKYNTPGKKYVVEYDKRTAAFIGTDYPRNRYFTTFDGDSDMFKIVGNVHDNIELVLKGGK